jgi:prepilin signal peptidase PulO-like enzyme (type II secretory pathway)
LYLGAPLIVAAVFIASVLGIVGGVFWLRSRQKKLKDPIPFGPFLAAGAVSILFFQEQLFSLYYYIP